MQIPYFSAIEGGVRYSEWKKAPDIAKELGHFCPSKCDKIITTFTLIMEEVNDYFLQAKSMEYLLYLYVPRRDQYLMVIKVFFIQSRSKLGQISSNLTPTRFFLFSKANLLTNMFFLVTWLFFYSQWQKALFCLNLSYCRLKLSPNQKPDPLLVSSRARIPVASQVTALEIWLLACILLVFGALAEYAFILRQVIRLSRQQRKEDELSSIQDGSPISSAGKRTGNAMGAPATPINLCSRPNSQISGKMGIAFQLNGRMGESVPDDLCNHDSQGQNQLRGGVLNDHEQRLLPAQHQHHHHHHHHHFHGHSHRPYQCSGERVPLQAFGTRTNGLEGGHNSHSEPNVAPTEACLVGELCSNVHRRRPNHTWNVTPSPHSQLSPIFGDIASANKQASSSMSSGPVVDDGDLSSPNVSHENQTGRDAMKRAPQTTRGGCMNCFVCVDSYSLVLQFLTKHCTRQTKYHFNGVGHVLSQGLDNGIGWIFLG